MKAVRTTGVFRWDSGGLQEACILSGVRDEPTCPRETSPEVGSVSGPPCEKEERDSPDAICGLCRSESAVDRRHIVTYQPPAAETTGDLMRDLAHMLTLRRYLASTFTAAAIALQVATAPALDCEPTTMDMQHQHHSLATHTDPARRATAGASAAISPRAPHNGDHAPCRTPIGDGCLSGLLWTPPVAAASGDGALQPNRQSRIGTAIAALTSASPRRPVAPPPRA